MKKKISAKKAQVEFRKELERDYNLGWAEALFKVVEERGWWDKNAIYYRGTTFTYRELKEKGYEYAHSLKSLGVNEGDVIPFCTAHCPQEIFSLIGASLVGARVMPIGEHFDSDYFVERLKKKNAKVVIATNDKYPVIKNMLSEAGIKKVALFDLKKYYIDSSYEEEEKPYLGNIKPASSYIKDGNGVISETGFLCCGSAYYNANGFTEAVGHLDDEFSITYSSGTTNSHRPKPIKHKNSTYIGMGLIRAKETPDLNKFSKTGEIKALVHIPLYSNTSLLASISDELFLGATLCLEPIYDEKYAAIALLKNRPNLAIMTPSHWITAMKRLMFEDKFKDADLKCLMAPFTAGEPTSAGEEKFINRAFKKLQVSKDFPVFKAIIALGMGAGDCENSGLWRMPHRATMNKLKKIVNFRKKNVEKGYETYSVVDYAILGPDGEHLGPNELGKLVIDAPFTMSGYDDMPEETATTKVTDAEGKIWTDCRLWCYYDEMGEVFPKGRYSKEEDFPLFMIDDEICKDTKRIMSCKTVKTSDGAYVAHIDLQPDKNPSMEELLYSIQSRLGNTVPNEILERLIFKVRPRIYSYPLTGSGKRSASLLEEEGLDNTYRVVSDFSRIETVSGSSYISYLNNGKKHIMDKKS